MTTKGCLPPDGPPCIQSCESTLTKGCEFCTFHNNLGEHGTDDQITGGDGDSEGDRSRPPTPFSRPLTARNVAQRPATTTIFERESDAKRASRSGFSGGAAADPSFPPRPRSRMGMPVSDIKGMNSGATTKADEAFPAIFVGKKSSSLNIHNGDGGRDEEIDKLKRFLQEKGL